MKIEAENSNESQNPQLNIPAVSGRAFIKLKYNGRN